MHRLLAAAALFALAAPAPAHAQQQDLPQLIADTPCLYELRRWNLQATAIDGFSVPQEFTRTQCEVAARVNARIEKERLDGIEAARAAAAPAPTSPDAACDRAYESWRLVRNPTQSFEEALRSWTAFAEFEPRACAASHARYTEREQRAEAARLATVRAEQARTDAEQAQARRQEEQARRAAQAARRAAEEQARRPGARIGMTAEEVLTATNWGKPRSISRTVTDRGTVEHWWYGEGQMLTLQNGRLIVIQN